MTRTRHPRINWWLARIIAVLLVAAGLGAWQFSVHDHRRREDAAALRLDEAFGATVEPLDDDIAADLGLPMGSQGLVLTSLSEDGPSRRAGLRPGDVIEAIGGTSIDDPLSAAEAIGPVRGGPVELIVNRHGRMQQVQLDGRVSERAARSDRKGAEDQR